MKKHDVILVAVIIFMVLTGFGGLKVYQRQNEKEPRFAVITQDNVLVERIDLNAVEEPREIILPGPYHEILRVEKGRIRFKEADCPDRICVRRGWLQNPGEIAVCLPNKAVVRITGD
ncbi:secreted protein [Desulfocucumis palustris]|uniref:Secreted protein n=1 Tax=Desulfocucumis palustris TaxID=1898651 RepID=A0A2L2XEB6_9FIRM|nr:NusG domain II-containing protein [Desulfocucumis palustris]GBF34344.1 secreted protein [Desulfocucumis palustris]